MAGCATSGLLRHSACPYEENLATAPSKLHAGLFQTEARGREASTLNAWRDKKWFPERGFGFIARHDNQPDVFVHTTSFTNLPKGTDPNVGDEVEFDMVTASGRPRAGNGGARQFPISPPS